MTGIIKKVVSHDGNELEAINISTAREILLQNLSQFDVIGIDEIQFLIMKLYI